MKAHKALLLLTMTLPATAFAQSESGAKAGPAEEADARARVIEARMTDEERTHLTHGIMALPLDGTNVPAGVPFGAGYIEGIERLNVPALTETDASLGVAYIGGLRRDGATALPSGLAMGATWSPELMHRGGAMIAGEAHAKGFNTLLAGGINLVRDPRNGRNFEYLGEDPLHSGLLGGAAIAGVQSRNVISTIKHFAINATETGRHFSDSQISDAALRMSDLLAFPIAIEQGKPGAVMCAYNRVNGTQACGSDYLLNRVLKQDWKYRSTARRRAAAITCSIACSSRTGNIRASSCRIGARSTIWISRSRGLTSNRASSSIRRFFSATGCWRQRKATGIIVPA